MPLSAADHVITGRWEGVFQTVKHVMLGNPAEASQQEQLKNALEEDQERYRLVIELAAHSVDLPDGWADMTAGSLDKDPNEVLRADDDGPEDDPFDGGGDVDL